jgi:hypothetical protein
MGTAAGATTPISATKVCTPGIDGVPFQAFQLRVGQSLPCVVTVTFPAGTTVTPVAARVTLTPTNSQFGVGGSITAGAGTNVGTFTCAPVAGTVTCTFTELITPAEACVPLTQTIVVPFPGGTTFSPPIANAAGRLIEVLPKAGGDCEVPNKIVTKTCAPTATDGVPFPSR